MMLPDETFMFLLEPTASMLLMPVTTRSSMTVTPTVSPQPFSSSGARTSTTLTTSLQPSTSMLPPAAEASSTTSVDSPSPLPSQPITSTLLPVESSTQPPAELPSTTSVDGSSPLPLQPSSSTRLPVESSTQPSAELPSTTSVDSPSPLPSQPSTSMLPPVLTSPVPEPSTISITSTEASAEPTSSPVPSSTSAMLIAIVFSSSLVRGVTSTPTLTTSTRDREVLLSSSISETAPTSTPGQVLPSSSAVLPFTGSSELVSLSESQTESAVSSTSVSFPTTTSISTPRSSTSPPPSSSTSPPPSSSTSPPPSSSTSPPPSSSTSPPPSTTPPSSSTSPPPSSSTSPPPSSSASPPLPTSTSPEEVSTSSAILPVLSTQIQPPLPTVGTMIPSPPPIPEDTNSLLPSATPSPTGGGDGGPPTTSSTGTTGTSTTPSDEPTSTPSFFTLPVIVGISAGGAVIAILVFVILILCCCCVCSHMRKSRRYSMQDSAENPTSIFANGQYPQKRRESNGSVQAYELNYIQVENPAYEDSEDHLQGPISQVSATGTDLFRESSLPGISPLSYNSQLMGVNGLYQLSVDHPNEASLSDANARSSLLGKFPHSSPSLAVPTRMGLSLEKEETKSSHGSRTSIPGSSKPPSYQSSKASILGSKHSIQSSRSSFLNSTYSRDDMRPLFLERQNSSSPEDDFLTAHLPRRTGSALLKGDTIESPTDDSLVPTRDSPFGVPLATSRPLKEGKKDFASLTCIPNHQAIADEFGLDFLQKPLSESTPKVDGQGRELPRSVPYESHASESILSSPQRRSGSKINLGALTTLEQGPRNEAVKPTDATAPATPMTAPEPVSKMSDNSEAKGKKETPKSSPAAKKPKSRAMSKLEKLTSLDYIRASLRLKKKKVSFEKTPESAAPKSKKKKPVAEPEPVVLANAAAASASGENGLESSIDRSSVPYQEPKRTPVDTSDAQHPLEDDIFSPDIYPEDFGGGFQRHYTGRPRTYSDMHGTHPQLSQPTYFPGHMGGGQFQSTYPQLSQQYYPQLSQGAYYPSHLPYPHARAPLPLPSHSLPPQPSPAHQTSGGSGGEPYGRRYSDAAILGAGRYPDMVTPDAYLPPNHNRFRDIPSPDQYPGGARSPDRFTETSNTSERYQATSPDYLDMPGRYRDATSPDRWTDSSYLNSMRYDEPVSPTRFGYTAQERFIDDRHRGSKDHFLEMDNGRQRHSSETRLPENFDGSRRHSLEMHNRYPDGMDSGRRNLQKGQPDRPGRDADHKRQHSSDIMYRERRPSLQGQLTDRYSDSFSDREVRSPGRYSTYSDTSTSDKFSSTAAPKSHVSWSTEVIEYPRTPSPDLEYGSDLDAL